MVKGKHHTEESKQKIKEARKWQFQPYRSEETKKKIGLANKGRKLSKETIEKRTKSREGFHHSLESRKKMSESRKGHYVSPETRKKLSDKNKISLKGKHHSIETRKKMSLAKKGKPKSEESKQKMSESKKKLIEKLGYVPGGGYYNDTKPEIEAENILQKYNLNYKKQKALKYNNRYRLYDFLLTDYNILLEIDGTYWHSKGIKDEDIKSECLKETRINDHIKDKLAQDNGYTLIRIWEDELFKLDEYCSKELFYRKKEVS